MLYLYEILEVINENAIIILYNSNQEIIKIYDGKEDLEEYSEYIINDIFPDYFKTNKGDHIAALGIEIESEDE